MKAIITILIVIALPIHALGAWAIVGNPLLRAYLCNGTDKVVAVYESGLGPEEENQYNLNIEEKLTKNSRIKIRFDAEAKVTLTNSNYSRIHAEADNVFFIYFFKTMTYNIFDLNVKGIRQGIVPYPLSININTEEYCEHPITGVLDRYLQGVKDTAESVIKKPSRPSCGRRMVEHTELITNNLPTKAGDWPWHVAIYRFEHGSLTYKCGGTLVGKNTVVTAAHCATIRGVPLAPELVNVVLGKYNLVGGDIGSQDREVYEIKVHEKYNISNLDNDIAVLKLKTEAVFNDYVQPACIWNPGVIDRLDRGTIVGTVVGWGFDHTAQLSSQLREATMPKISESKCLKSNPVFFGKMLNDYKFCAGYRNGTSACNGDSGGGFSVFVPDDPGSNSGLEVQGAWYLRGIVSVGIARKDVALCDSNNYVLFTDAAKYRNWIEEHL